MFSVSEETVSIENFAGWLESELAARNWRPADLAKRSALPQATISNILNGNRDIGPKVAVMIADALELSPVYVFRRAGLLPPEEGTPADFSFDEILEIMKNLPPAERREIVDYALFRFRRSRDRRQS